MEMQYRVTYTYDLPTTLYYGVTTVWAATSKEAEEVARQNILRKVPSAVNFRVTGVVTMYGAQREQAR